MGLAADLGYRHRTSNPLHRAVLRAAGTVPGAWVLSRVLRHADAAVGRLTRGRHTAPSLLTGLAVLTLTTTGRRSGRPRTTHLIAAPHGDDLALLGTNFGQQSTPAWVLNLEADPHATVAYRGRTRAVVARLATPAEADEVFEEAATFYVGYRHYRSRVGGRRHVRVFVLEPVHIR